MQAAGLTVDAPSIIAGDSFAHNARAVVNDVLRHAKDGGEIVFHLGGPNAPVTLEALKQVVPLLEKKGYAFGRR